jgi:hypothetical protein
LARTVESEALLDAPVATAEAAKWEPPTVSTEVAKEGLPTTGVSQAVAEEGIVMEGTSKAALATAGMPCASVGMIIEGLPTEGAVVVVEGAFMAWVLEGVAVEAVAVAVHGATVVGVAVAGAAGLATMDRYRGASGKATGRSGRRTRRWW